MLGDPKFGNMVSKLSDDKASPLEKAGAILGFGVPAGGAMAEIAPKLQDEMGKVNGSLGLAHNAVTLIDPKATGREKADAGLKLFGNAATTLDALKGFKHKQAEEIGQEARNVENAESRKPGETKPEETKDGKMPGELCYLARVGVGLNTADAALGDKGQVCTLQPASGVEFTNS